MCAHVYFICKATESLSIYVGACIHACKCRGQRRTLDVFLFYLAPFFLKIFCYVFLYAGLGDGGGGGGMVYVLKFEVSSSFIFKLVLGIEHKSLGL